MFDVYYHPLCVIAIQIEWLQHQYNINDIKKYKKNVYLLMAVNINELKSRKKILALFSAPALSVRNWSFTTLLPQENVCQYSVQLCY